MSELPLRRWDSDREGDMYELEAPTWDGHVLYYRCDEADALLASQREEIARLREAVAGHHFVTNERDRLDRALTERDGHIATLTATNERLAKDAGRLDWLEAMGNAKGGLLLHSEVGSTGRTGLGLGCTGRTLRQAIDDAAQPAQPDEKGA